ncbi:MAG: glycosyltransferase [Rhodovibrio sp.]|nr:glycosyltransferase [Rhodovibrio sp.]
MAARVRYAGATESRATSTALASADLFVWPAVNEAYGMALLEAQAAGCPAVCGDFGGVSAILSDRETGRLVPPDDPDAFAGAVGELLDDPAARATMGAAARAKVARSHTVDTAAQRLSALLAEVTGVPA